MRRILTWALWILLILALAAVIYFVWTQFFGGGDEKAIGSFVILECTSACTQHGQCGTTEESPKVPVVLGGVDAPVVEPLKQDRFIPAGVTVEVKETRTERLEQVNGRQYDQDFSRVEWRNAIGDVQKTGWFADWCISNP
jgi:hypothetical protein